MASAPLFVNDIETLRAKLRLSGISDTSNANDVLGGVVSAVRAGFYARLGETRVAELVAIPFVESPTTRLASLRAIANDVETKWVRRELMTQLPSLFSAGMGAANEAWNTEAPFRDMSAADVRDLSKLLSEQIETGLTTLEDDDSFPLEQSGAHVTVIGADRPELIGFDRTYGYGRYL